MRAGTIVLVAATVFGLGCWVGRLAKTGRWSSGAGRAHGAVGRAFPDARPLGARVAQMGGRATRFDAFFVRASVSAASERFGLSLEKMGAEIGRHQIGKTRIVRYTDRRGVTSYAIFSPGPKGNGCTVQIAHAPASAGGIERRGVPKTEPSDVPPPPSSQTLFHAAGGSKNPSTLSLLETTAGVEETGSKTTMIADVHTDGNTRQALEEGVGYIQHITVAYQLPDGRIAVGRGPVFSYYEFKQPLADRLTDEAWRQMLEYGQAPAPPEWTSSFKTW